MRLRLVAAVLAVLSGCGGITGQEYCVRYYEAYCGDCGRPCGDEILSEDGSAEGYCSNDEEEPLEDSRLLSCFLDEFEATCDEAAASAACE